MNIVIVGGGLAGTLAAKALRELDPEVGIEIFGEERQPYYPRPNLIEFLAGRLPLEKVFAFPEGWAAKQRIGLRLGETVVRVRPAGRTVETAAGDSRPYDALLLATGARASLPPVPGTDRKGVFVLRTLDDALALADHLRDHRRTVILGGGLLGLEIARAVRDAAAPRSGSSSSSTGSCPASSIPAAAAILKGQFEKMGVSVVLGAVTREILGDGSVRGLRLECGAEIEADAVVVAAGIKPEIGPGPRGRPHRRQAASSSTTACARRTRPSSPPATPRNTGAASTASSRRPSNRPARPPATCSARTCPTPGTVPANTLKVAGLAVTSVGEFGAEGPGYESIVRADPERGLYKKIVLQDGRAVGAIWMGTSKGASDIGRLVALRKDVGSRKGDLLEDSFDFSEIA